MLISEEPGFSDVRYSMYFQTQSSFVQYSSRISQIFAVPLSNDGKPKKASNMFINPQQNKNIAEFQIGRQFVFIYMYIQIYTLCMYVHIYIYIILLYYVIELQYIYMYMYHVFSLSLYAQRMAPILVVMLICTISPWITSIVASQPVGDVLGQAFCLVTGQLPNKTSQL